MTGTPTKQTQDRGEESTEGRASIRVYPDGPLIVRGSFSITDEHGRAIEIARKTVSLCRCGRSGLAPLCDGSHARSRRGHVETSTSRAF
ncbi:MAG: CDGSH iron-sulfur domain-containing protein [Actinomycetota bacterium]